MAQVTEVPDDSFDLVLRRRTEKKNVPFSAPEIRLVKGAEEDRREI
jgi:hypothetical protein